MTCPSCGAALAVDARFCENCGTQVAEQVAAVVDQGASATTVADEPSPVSAPTRPAGPAPAPAAEGPRPCLSCGGEVGDDGYCHTCGAKAPSERDHFREAPAPWVAGVCDRGISHARNEDAMALLGSPAPGERAVLVVLDGVSNTVDSHLASLAGARAARDVLRTPLPRGMGTPESRRAAVVRAFTGAVEAANDAVVATVDREVDNPPSATFAAAVLEGRSLWFANVGDSRVYWLPDDGTPEQLTVDDSAAQEQIAAGMSREAAETGPQGHAITRWLGRDAPDLTPRVGDRELDRPGWVLACSDGLWNYASAADDLAGRLRAAAGGAGARDPLPVAVALVDFANAQGGRDNITVALARVDVQTEDPTGVGESDG